MKRKIKYTEIDTVSKDFLFFKDEGKQLSFLPKLNSKVLSRSEATAYIEQAKGTLIKGYRDRHHVIGRPFCKKSGGKRRGKTKKDEVFDGYFSACFDPKKSFDDVFKEICECYEEDGEYPDLKYIADMLERKRRSMYAKRKLAEKKAQMNKWTHFITVTYDSKKIDSEEAFRKKLNKVLANFKTRRGWMTLGTYERGETERLHFHALLYVPKGQMVGEIKTFKSYATAQHKMQETQENTFFLANFGHNDFQRIDEFELQFGNVVEYVLKYMWKEDGKMRYSRGLVSDFFILTEKIKEVVSLVINYWGNPFLLRNDILNMTDPDVEVVMLC